MQRGDRIELPGKILKVRTAALDEDSSIAVLDFRITNPSDVLFEVRTVTVEMEDNQGKSYLGQSVERNGCQAALRRTAGARARNTTQTLLMRERLGSHGSPDRMIAARFQAPARHARRRASASSCGLRKWMARRSSTRSVSALVALAAVHSGARAASARWDGDSGSPEEQGLHAPLRKPRIRWRLWSSPP